MNDDVRLSIITPVYNTREYIDKCVRSALDQIDPADEIVIIDDGSTDGSGDLCENFRALDSRVILHKQSNKGLSASRNAALDLASGDYAVFLDSDDWLEPRALERIRTALERRPDILISRCNLYFQNNMNGGTHGDAYGIPIQERWTGENLAAIQEDAEAMRDALLDSAVVYMSTRTITSTRLIKELKLRFREGILHEDEEWLLRLFCAANSFAFMREPYYAYRLREGSISFSISPEKCLGLLAAAEAAEDIIRESQDMRPHTKKRLRDRQYYYCQRGLSTYMSLDDDARERIARRLSDTPTACKRMIKLITRSSANWESEHIVSVLESIERCDDCAQLGRTTAVILEAFVGLTRGCNARAGDSGGAD
ncbi:MAG: glycosyltransferase [Oscillospiraceae bacterium]|jgi:glycosyltransferase involved in cell wall biosynthesis|nr:glycosyltransferase [Oscillospiraceae bacterium]